MRSPIRYALVCALLPLLTCLGCAAGRPPAVTFENSHQRFLERVIGDLDVTEVVAETVEPGTVVSVVSMESPYTTDTPLVAMLEDAIIGQLLAAGYGVLERDEDLMLRLVGESSGSGYTYISPPGRLTVTSAGAQVAGGPYGYGVAGSAAVTSLRGALRDTFVTYETRLATATCLVSYRVLECGLVYRPGEVEGRKSREAQVRLHVRIHDAASGELLAARSVESRGTDSVDADAAKWLADYHYSFFGPDLPLERGTGSYQEVGGSQGRQGQTSSSSVNPR